MLRIRICFILGSRKKHTYRAYRAGDLFLARARRKIIDETSKCVCMRPI